VPNRNGHFQFKWQWYNLRSEASENVASLNMFPEISIEKPKTRKALPV